MTKDTGSIELRDQQARTFREITGDIVNLCDAVKVLSSVLADQLQDPRGPMVTSDFGLEIQSFDIDAGMVRYVADHAAALALELRHKVA